MITATKKYTANEFRQLEEGDYQQLINQQLIMSPSPSSKHQEISAVIFTQIYSFVQKNKLGKAFCAPLDVYFDEDNVFEPDILFVSAQRMDIIKENGIHGAPDIILEILSVSSGYHDTKTKKRIYEKHGVKEYWMVDPMDGEVMGYKNKNGKFVEIHKGMGPFTLQILNLKIQMTDN